MSLIGKNNRKTVLNENAMLFQAHEEKTEKQKWSEMNRTQRLHYFLDYYLLKYIIIVFIVTFAGILLWRIFSPKSETKLFIAVVQNSFLPEAKQQLEEQLIDLLVTDKKHQEINLDDTFPAGYESEAKLAAYLNARELDLIITNELQFKEMAAAGMFEDIEKLMPSFAAAHKNILYRTQGYSDNDENSARVSSNDQKSSLPAYGINISDCKSLQSAWTDSNSKLVLGIVYTSNRKENAKRVLTRLLFP